MTTRPGLLTRLLIALLALAMFAAACGDDDDDTSAGDNVTSADDGAEADDDGAMAETDDGAMEESDDGAMEEGETLKVAIVAPSAVDDFAFTQSMIESIEALSVDVDLSVTDGTFIVEDAAAALRGYAEAGNDIIVAHGTQFGSSLAEIAPDFPEIMFVWGTSTTTEIENVFAYYPAAEEGGYVNGVLAASLTESGIIGVIGPVQAGDAVTYVAGFEEGAAAAGASETKVIWTDNFGDVTLAREAAVAHVENGADVLTGTAQMVVGAIGYAVEEGIPWFGTQSNQTDLASDIVVASQVYHWEVVLEEMLTLRESGTLGGQAFEINMANGGLVIEFNEAYDLPAEALAAAEQAIADITSGAIDPLG